METKVQFFEAGNLFFRKMSLAAGLQVSKHVHAYDHASLLLSGECLLFVNGDEVPCHAGQPVEILAGQAHAIYAVTDIEWLCIHPNPEKLPIDQIEIKVQAESRVS